MRDQAEQLRMQMLKVEGKLAKSIAVVSGKGGVGKSNFTTNFAYALKLQGKRVLIIDMDIGMGNIHILLGKIPPYHLKDYLTGEVPLHDVIVNYEEGFSFISGGSGLDSVLEWTSPMFERLLFAFETLQKEFDFILFDMGAGATKQSIDLLLAVDEIIVIVTTEPTSITDAYSMMKFICLEDPTKVFYLVNNRVITSENGQDAVERLQFAARKFLNNEATILGYLPEDSIVHQSVVGQQPFLQRFPDAKISKKMISIATNFIETEIVHRQKESSGFLGKLKKLFKKGRD